ncbi:MAG: leucine-rich repeat domain-containing protein [Promethearchaeia archaeon]
MINSKQEFEINEHITLKLEPVVPDEGFFGSAINKVLQRVLNTEGLRTMIYIDGERFEQCKYLLLDVPLRQIKDLDHIRSIDEAAEKLDRSQELFSDHEKVTPETEFWAHCSNLQAWAESGYNTNILHKNLAFPLLKRLTEVGDVQAKKVFKEEIVNRFLSGHYSVMKYLINEGYLHYFSDEEFSFLLEQLNQHDISYVIYEKRELGFVHNNKLDLSNQGIRTISQIQGLNKLSNLRELNLSYNHIKEIKGLDNLQSLKKLNLSFNHIKEIKNLDNLSNLRELELQGNRIREIKGLENLKKLNVISMWLNPIKITEISKLLLSPQRLINYCKKKKQRRESNK